ncbi:MAG TPA: hypothetical protein VFR81_25090, partial [Longimicrobium sp.]|nr:hypothetical protein [Longimicrobium sp.]
MASLRRIIEAEQEERRKIEIARARAARNEYLRGEVAGAANLSVALLDLVGDRHTGRIISGATEAGLQASRAFEAFAVGAIGPLALAGGLVGAAMILVRLFSSGPSADEMILTGINDLRRDLQQMRQEMHQRFDRLERNQLVIIEQLANLLGEVRTGNAVIIGQLRDLHSQVARAIEVGRLTRREAARTTFGSDMRSIKNLLALGSTPLIKAQIAILLGRVAGYGLEVGAETSFIGSERDSADPRSFRNFIHERRRLDLIFGVLPTIARSFGLATPQMRPLVDPVAWVVASQSFLEAAISAGMGRDPTSAVTAKEMWDAG